MKSGYHGLEALWHDLFWEAEEAPSEVLLIDDFLQEKDGVSLYVGSGSGRLLGPLVEAGHELEGLEISSEMVALSRENYPSTKVVEGSWQDHQSDGKYSSIVIPAFTFQLFEDPQRQLRRLREQTDHLYLTLFFPWAELSGDLPANEWYFDRGISLPSGEMGELQTRHKIKEHSGSLVRKHRYTMKDAAGEVVKKEETEQRMRFFTDVALKNLLKKTGWKVAKEIYNLGDGDEDDLIYVSTLHLTGHEIPT
ncbi:MAG: hypothetical protein ACJAQT_002446 [Akkermansiaceae bacterium]|jgi:hypothetical protein